MQVPTIAIADSDQPNGYRLINETDFNTDEHKRYAGKQPVTLAAEAPTEIEPFVPKPTVQPSDRLEGLTLTQLRGLAQTEDIRGRTTMDQDELIAALEKKGYKRTTSEL